MACSHPDLSKRFLEAWDEGEPPAVLQVLELAHGLDANPVPLLRDLAIAKTPLWQVGWSGDELGLLARVCCGGEAQALALLQVHTDKAYRYVERGSTLPPIVYHTAPGAAESIVDWLGENELPYSYLDDLIAALLVCYAARSQDSTSAGAAPTPVPLPDSS